MSSTSNPVVIVTAANESYARTLWQFLKSAKRAGLPKLYQFVAYDLGLTESTRNFLQSKFPWCQFKRFNFEDHPAHASMNPNNFAWKPLIIAEEFNTHDGIVFWFDSAVIFKSNLEIALQRITTDGVWYLRGHTSLEKRANPNALDKMQVPLEMRHLPEISGGSIGFSTTHPAARELVSNWRDYACEKTVIAEQDSPYIFTSDGQEIWHQFDQAILSGLVLTMVFNGVLPLRKDEVDISSTNPVQFISTRNKVNLATPTWADPLVRAYYKTYKFSDQNWLRLSRNFAKLEGGFQRHLKEHFVVTVQNEKSDVTRNIPSPRYGYYADPFIWQRENKTWVFVEEYQCYKDQGRLVAIQLDEQLQPTQHLPLTMTPDYAAIEGHASFPFLFETAGEIYMIPETCSRRSVDLYVCEKWPHIWTLKRRMLFGLDAADTMITKHGKLWWLLTSVRGTTGNRTLQIFSMENLHDAAPVPHPMNQLNLYHDLKNDTGRNAGLLVEQPDGSLLRFSQNSADRYGQGGMFKRIEILDKLNFQESDQITQTPLRESHHFNKHGHLSTWDHRKR